MNSDLRGSMTKSTTFWLIIAIMQPLVYFISMEYFGQVIAIIIPWLFLIFYIIWIKVTRTEISENEEE